MNRYFNLHQDCQIIKGIKNTLLCDLYKNNIVNINDLQHFFIQDKAILYTDDSKEFIEFLLSEEFGYISDEVNLHQFKKITWQSPKTINEIIIEHAKKDHFLLEETYKKIESTGAEFLQIRFLQFSYSKLRKIISLLSTSCVRTIEILLPYMNEERNNSVIKILERNPRIQIVYFYNSPFNKSIKSDYYFTILYYEKNLVDQKLCGVINQDYFLTDIKNYSKSMCVNNCLKDKLFISYMGEIRNCPSMNHKIGDLNLDSFSSLMKRIEQDSIRNITKDEIETCKDCEYRYFCIDCRAYTDNPENIYSKPLKCGYNPYIGEWKDWSTNPLKQKAIQYYGMDKI